MALITKEWKSMGSDQKQIFYQFSKLDQNRFNQNKVKKRDSKKENKMSHIYKQENPLSPQTMYTVDESVN